MNRQLYVLVGLTCATMVAAGSDETVRERDIGADRFVAGGRASVSRPVDGDLLAAGGEVNIAAPVGGDAVAVGGEVRIDGLVSQDLYAAGGRVSLNSTVQRNARVAGGTLDIGSQGRIAGNLTAAGGEINLRGGVTGYVQSAGGRIYIDAPVGGDVELSGGEIRLGPNARIIGRLRYASSEELERDPAAQVLGGIEQIRRESPWPRQAGRDFLRVACWIWTVGLMVVAVALVSTLPAFFARVADTARRRLPFSLLLGFITLVCIPVAVLLLLVTGIGAPLGLLGAMAFVASLLVGYASTCIALGDSVLRRLKPERAQALVWRAGAAVLAVLAIGLVARVPFLGVFVVLLTLLAGLGALWIQLHRSFRAAAA